MKNLTLAAFFLCGFSTAGFAQDPAPGGASQGVATAGTGVTSSTAVVVTASVIAVGAGAALAAVVSSSSGTTPTTSH